MPSSSLLRILWQFNLKKILRLRSVRVNKWLKLTNDMTLHLIQLLCRLWNYRDFIVDPQRLQERVTSWRASSRRRWALSLIIFLGHGAVGWVDVILEELVHAESGRADGTLVGEMSRFKGHAVVARNMIEKLPLENLRKTVNYFPIKNWGFVNSLFHKLGIDPSPCRCWQLPALNL